MRRIHSGAILLWAGATWAMAPATGLLHNVGGLVVLGSLPILLSGVSNLQFDERIAATKYAFALILIGVTFQGLLTPSSGDIITRTGVVMSHPWAVAGYQASIACGTVIAGAALCRNVCEVEGFLVDTDERPPGPDDF